MFVGYESVCVCAWVCGMSVESLFGSTGWYTKEEKGLDWWESQYKKKGFDELRMFLKCDYSLIHWFTDSLIHSPSQSTTTTTTIGTRKQANKQLVQSTQAITSYAACHESIAQSLLPKADHGTANERPFHTFPIHHSSPFSKSTANSSNEWRVESVKMYDFSRPLGV